MGQGPSGLRQPQQRCRAERRQLSNDKGGAQLRRRIQLLEELCSHQEPGRRAEVLQQLAGGHADDETLDVAHVLASRPLEFSPGELIAAGSYGRVYAGTYAGQPAALKLLLLDEETAHAILNEVRLCLKLSHKNLVQLLDCAVVATSKQAGSAGFMCAASPGFNPAGQHQVLPVFGPSSSPATPSAAPTYSYLPVVSGQLPFDSTSVLSARLVSSSMAASSSSITADHRDTGSPPGQDLEQHDVDRRAVLCPTLSHACFEVWIAMELCDGGTLAEQLQRGFHCHPGSEQVDMEQLLQVGLDIARALSYMHGESVCHGDLKTENVLLKTLSAASEGMHCMGSAQGKSAGSCCHEDCNWLTFLCNNSPGTSCTASRYCRSFSCESSCWSCYSCAVGCIDPGGNSSPGSCSTSSSNLSGANAERRSRSGFKGSHLLSGLCCMGSPSSCATEDDMWAQQDERVVASGCLGCGIMTLEPSERGGYSTQVLAAQQQLRSEQELLCAPAAQQQHQVAAELGFGSVLSTSSHAELAPASLPDAFALPSSSAQVYNSLHVASQGLTPTIVEGVVQQLQVPLSFAGGLYDEWAPQPAVLPLEDVPEEEHVAPLSLYTEARQRRRSRCLPLGVVLPTALAAAAAAAAAAMNGSDPHHPLAASSEHSSSGSDEEGLGNKMLGSCAGVPQQQSVQCPVSCEDSVPSFPAAAAAGTQHEAAAAGAAAAAAASVSSDPLSARPNWHDAAGLAGAGSHLDVYSMMLPPVPRRARRHSYCCGSTPTYGGPVFSFGRPGLPRAALNPAGSISATEAAAAIAAAAEAVRFDSARAVSAAERGRSRSRRMSWDDRMLSHQSPTCSGLRGLLGGLSGLSRGADTGGAQHPASLWQQQQTDVTYQSGRTRRTRRHSWAGYLQPDMAPAAAGVLAPFGLPYPREQQQQLSRLSPIRSDSVTSDSVQAVATPDAAGLGAMPSSRRGGGRARRHSWAGYGREQGFSKLSGVRALSSSFFAGGGDSMSHGSMHCSPQRHSFSLPPFAGCCGDSMFHPLDDTCSDAECSRHALMEGATSSTLLAVGMPSHSLGNAEETEAAGIGCFGRWCSSGTSSSFASSCGSAVRDRRRRCSWCCGAGSEADLWAEHLEESSASQLQLLLPAAPLSVPLMPQQPRKGRPDRRCSWDDTRYRSKLGNGWGRKANSVDAQSLRSSCNSRHPSSPASGASHLMRSSSGDAAPCQFAADSAAGAAASSGASQSAGLKLSPPMIGALSAASSRSTQQEQPDSQLMQLISPTLSCNASPAAPSMCTTPVAPIMGIKPRSPVAAAAAVAAVEQPVAGYSQCFSGPNACMGPAPSANTSRMRVALGQAPLPLLLPSPDPPSQQQQQQNVVQKPFACADLGDLQSSRDVAAAHGLWQAPAPLSVPAAGSSASCSLVGPSTLAASAAAVRQAPVQELVSMCDAGEVAAPSAVAAFSVQPGITHGSMVSSTAGAHDGEQDLFTGSFTLHPSSSHAVGAAQQGGGAAAAPRRGRRWSTGVAAHQLLMRKELLDVHGSDVLRDLGLAGMEAQGDEAAAASTGCSSLAAGSGLQASTSSQPRWQPVCSVPVVGADVPAEPAHSCVPMAGSYSSSASGNQRQQASRTSSVTNNAINVLGIPRERSSVVSQRRMSYDTATGAYQLVSQLDVAHLSSTALEAAACVQPLQRDVLAAAAEQQPCTQQPQLGAPRPDVAELLFSWTVRAAAPAAAEAGVAVNMQPSPAGIGLQDTTAFPVPPLKLTEQLQEEQMQQHCQAQMQRLLEALAKKGYGGLEDSSVHTGSHSANAQRPQQAGQGTAGTAALQQQQQQELQPVLQRAFCAKVCDFGFSKCLRAGQSHCSTASAGTITHQAPEVLRHGHLSPAADVYAFGIILWELLTRDRPFKGLLEGDLVVGVCDQGLRPTFPPGCPASYVALAQQCWSEDMTQRPTASQLVVRLNKLLYEERRARMQFTPAHTTLLGPKDAVRRRRRHSMPIASGHSKQRRRSRRMSLFLLPFMRQPVVPEDAPLEQQVGDWCSRSGQHAYPAHSAAAAAAAVAMPGSSSHGRGSMEQQAGSACGGSPQRHSSDRQPSSSGLNSIGNSGCMVSTTGSGSMNAVTHAGGLLASSSTLGGLKGAPSAAAPAGSSAAEHTHRSAPDGTEWFESF